MKVIAVYKTVLCGIETKSIVVSSLHFNRGKL